MNVSITILVKVYEVVHFLQHLMDAISSGLLAALSLAALIYAASGLVAEPVVASRGSLLAASCVN